MRAARRWGATDAEVAARVPCDELLPDAPAVDRAVSVRAEPAVVFRWLCQLRAAPYSYDWIDNLGRRSPRQLIEGLDQLEIGQRFMTIFRLAALERGRSITLDSTTGLFGRVAVSYLVAPAGKNGTRLVVKLVFVTPRSLPGRVMQRILPYGDLIMMRRQLLTLKALAERLASAGENVER